MFFWRAINAEVWLRIFIDDPTVSLEQRDEPGWYAHRADTAFAQGNPVLEELVEASLPNRGHHIFQRSDNATIARVPLHSRLIGAGDSLIDALLESLDKLAARGVKPQDGDVILCSEKALSISQRRAFPVDEIQISKLAAVLSRFVTKVPTGIGLGHPATMQLAINEVGIRRILLGAMAAAVTRPFGKRGVFYDITGRRAKAIDGPSKHNLPPYDKWASMAPDDCEGESRRIATAVGERFGCKVGAAIIDANDLHAEVFATTPDVTPEFVLSAVADNPLGQSDQQTPFGLVRKVTPSATPAKPAEMARAGA
jgi:F420-0:gamma-glutamyl ligase-like protein